MKADEAESYSWPNWVYRLNLNKLFEDVITVSSLLWAGMAVSMSDLVVKGSVTQLKLRVVMSVRIRS